jgi:hypothetical protein
MRPPNTLKDTIASCAGTTTATSEQIAMFVTDFMHSDEMHGPSQVVGREVERAP